MHLYLIGYRGCGKSTVGRHLASLLERPLIDSDHLIQAKSGVSIKEIFASQGEQGFRNLESTVIAEIAQSKTPSVVSLGGGAILRVENRAIIGRSGRCVWLSASPRVLLSRIVSDTESVNQRPALTDRNAFEEVETLLATRAPIYRSMADFTVNCETLSPDEVASEIAQWATR